MVICTRETFLETLKKVIDTRHQLRTCCLFCNKVHEELNTTSHNYESLLRSILPSITIIVIYERDLKQVLKSCGLFWQRGFICFDQLVSTRYFLARTRYQFQFFVFYVTLCHKRYYCSQASRKKYLISKQIFNEHFRNGRPSSCSFDHFSISNVIYIINLFYFLSKYF